MVGLACHRTQIHWTDKTQYHLLNERIKVNVSEQSKEEMKNKYDSHHCGLKDSTM